MLYFTSFILAKKLVKCWESIIKGIIVWFKGLSIMCKVYQEA